jgi:hypothetical protein
MAVVMHHRGSLHWLVAIAGCASASARPTDATARNTAAPDTKSEPHSPLDDALNVEVLALGAPPREKLRYQFPQGRSERLIIQLSLSSLLESPSTTLALDGVVLDLALILGSSYEVSEGLWACPLRLEVLRLSTPPTFDEQQRAALMTEVAPLSLVTGVFEFDAQGLMHEAVLTVPPEVGPRLLAVIGNVRTSLVSAPFPVEPVGVGARWRVRRTLDVGPMEVTQLVTYTLVQRMGSSLRIGLTLQQSAHPQELFLDAEGTRLSVESYEVSSSGSSLVDLETIAPLAALRGNSELHATLHRGGKSAPISLHGDMFVNVASAGGIQTLLEEQQPP